IRLKRGFMKVLYVGSKATGGADRNLGKEITELQRRFAAASADPVEVRILTDLKVEDLACERSRFHPDILHVASYSEKDALSLSDQSSTAVRVTPKMLRVLFPPKHTPQIIYLTTCNPPEIAKELVEIGAATMAIGSTAPISNRAARASAVAFYERLLAGITIED